MKQLDQQLHGYRHGHQLLSASIKLPKPDQDLVDRLSDIAGPLRPGERFEPYLTCYPLPSDSYYVVARTWQDFDAPRAGCVRTRSLFVPMDDWVAGVDIAGLIEALSKAGPFAQANRVEIGQSSSALPHASISQGIELVEALFLEERKPVVMFDATDPEVITLRLLTAFWPSFRRKFAASTFALSPRSLGGRSFDLVFAPKDARFRFSDWPGRRIDAGKQTEARHRWSNDIFERVFSGDSPSLFRNDTLGELSSEVGATEAELRISLLWNELNEKLKTSPNAVLGLLDIANSRSTRNIRAIKQLEPEIGRAAQLAVATLPPSEAWRFLLALIDKLWDIQLQLSVAKAIRGAAVKLASKEPVHAITNVEMLATARGRKLLLGAVGDGIAKGFNTQSASAATELDPADFLQLLLLSPAFAEATLSRYPALAERLATALAEAPKEILDEAKHRILRLLVTDSQGDAARILIANLSLDELLAETNLLNTANGLAAESLHGPLVERARAIGAIAELRDTVVGLPNSRSTDALLFRLVSPTREDLQWLLETTALDDKRRLPLLCHLLSSASAQQFESMVVGRLRDSTLKLLMRDPHSNFDVIERILEGEGEAPSFTVDNILQLLPYASKDRMQRLAVKALETILPQNTGKGRDNELDTFLGILGSSLNGSWTIRVGLERGVSSEVVSANLAAFNRSPPAVRQQIMLAVEDLAIMIVARGKIDYPEPAVADAASLLWDSAALSKQAFIRSSATLLPFLLRSWNAPASPLIAAAFPSVYLELKKTNDMPDFFKLFFGDLDRCRTIRRDLVDALMRSNWRATDIALAAARAGDPGRILRHIAKQEGGARVIADIEHNLSSIPGPWRSQVSGALKDL